MERTRQTVDPKIAALFPLWQRAGYSIETVALAFGYSEYLVQKHCPIRKWGNRKMSGRVVNILRKKFRYDGLLWGLYQRYRFIVDADPTIKESVLRLGLGIKQTANIGCLATWLALDAQKRWARERVALLTWNLVEDERVNEEAENERSAVMQNATGSQNAALLGNTGTGQQAPEYPRIQPPANKP